MAEPWHWWNLHSNCRSWEGEREIRRSDQCRVSRASRSEIANPEVSCDCARWLVFPPLLGLLFTRAALIVPDKFPQQLRGEEKTARLRYLCLDLFYKVVIEHQIILFDKINHERIYGSISEICATDVCFRKFYMLFIWTNKIITLNFHRIKSKPAKGRFQIWIWITNCNWQNYNQYFSIS